MLPGSQWTGRSRRCCLASACRGGTPALEHRLVIRGDLAGLAAAIGRRTTAWIIMIRRLLLVVIVICRMVVLSEHHFVAVAGLVRGRMRAAAGGRGIVRLVLLVHAQVGTLGDCSAAATACSHSVAARLLVMKL